MNNFILSNIRTRNDQQIDLIIIGETIPSLKVLRGHTDNKAYKANSDNANELVIGVSKTAGIENEEIKYYINGATLTNSNWTWDVSKPIYTNPAGDLTQIPPTIGVIQQIATPISSNKLIINIQQQIKLI